MALRRAAQRFFSSGYAGTSLDELSEATDMNRPSLYATFGNKLDLYRAALRSMAAALEEALAAALIGPGPIATVLMELYRAAIELHMQGDPGPQGCFLMSTALTPAQTDPDVASVLREALDRTESQFATRIERARDAGEVAASSDPQVLARLAASTLHMLAIRARSGEGRERLEQIAAETVSTLFPSPPTMRHGGSAS